ncbi:MAG: hypothetical protein EXS23_00170 [Pedosphaera sp.]|nr:hypothetical protein [Pedosphaera sp.]
MFRSQILFISRSRIASVITAILLNAIGVAVMVGVSLESFQLYGWVIFVLTPSILGFNTALLYSLGQKRSVGSTAALSCLSLLVVALAILIFAIEGLICLIMVLPIALPLCLLGAYIGHFTANCINRRYLKVLTSALLLAVTPLLTALEAQRTVSLPSSKVTTSIEVNCAVDKVWKLIPEFSAITSEPVLIFKAGIAFPLSCRMEGSGIGARRFCELSTGSMTETITAWNPPYHLAFEVLKTPPSMREISFYNNFHPPHIEGFYVSKKGEFRLTSLPNGRTRIDGTSHYENRLWPESYWLPISDFVVRQVQFRVLNHIKTLSESTPALTPDSNSSSPQ